MKKEIIKILKATNFTSSETNFTEKYYSLLADQILELSSQEKQKLLKEIEQILMDNITGNDLQTHKELNKVYKELEKLNLHTE